MVCDKAQQLITAVTAIEGVRALTVRDTVLVILTRDSYSRAEVIDLMESVGGARLDECEIVHSSMLRCWWD